MPHSEATPDQLKEKLSVAINKHMLLVKGRTKAIMAVSGPLEVLPRAIYSWLKKEDFPPNAANILVMLDDIIADFDRRISQRGTTIHIPIAPRIAQTDQPVAQTIPFQVTISKDSIKVTRENGNLIVRGLFSVNLT